MLPLPARTRRSQKARWQLRNRNAADGDLSFNCYVTTEFLYDQPYSDSKKTRITGPFTVESIPAPFVKDLEGAKQTEIEADKSVTRTGETLRRD